MIRLIVGAIFGALAGILLAPRSGSDTRAGLVERSGPLRAKARELGNNATDRFGPKLRARFAPIAARVRVRGRREATDPDLNGGTEEELRVAETVIDGANEEAKPRPAMHATMTRQGSGST